MRTERATLVEALSLPSRASLVSIVGGGGKSALLFALASALEARVVVTTTTRIFAAQMARARAQLSLATGSFEDVWPDAHSGLLVVGKVEGEKAHGIPPELPARWLARDDVDHVVVEADGSRMRPTKAPAEHEPVIADGTTHLAIVAGIDALDGPIEDVCHRPERVSALIGKTPAETLSVEDLARLLIDERGGCKNQPDDARTTIVLNKVESPVQRERADRVAAVALSEGAIERVIAGAFEGPDPLYWRVYQRA
ncbi:MAG: selenium cofactor biosynthesis protein YqeC [Myxococcota bacterium]|nr:selenium cofactor biosynthesis protein YqeC [Myxococcota bacterium]